MSELNSLKKPPHKNVVQENEHIGLRMNQMNQDPLWIAIDGVKELISACFLGETNPTQRVALERAHTLMTKAQANHLNPYRSHHTRYQPGIARIVHEGAQDEILRYANERAESVQELYSPLSQSYDNQG